MKKILAIALALVLVLACFTGCGAKGKTLAEVKEAGKLVIATSPDFPPFENLENGEVVGIEIDILKLVCQDLGVELVIEQMDFSAVLPGVQAAKYDVGVSGITITEKRQKNMLFTQPYYEAAQVIVVKEGSPITSKADLAGKKVSAQTGTTAEEYCLEKGYAVSSFEANSDAQLALLNGNVDAWVIDNCTAKEMVELHNSEDAANPLVILSDIMTTEPYAFAFAFGSEDLVEAVDKSLDKLLADGTIQSIFDKYEYEYEAPQK
ncbi:MAG: transporter substrate-binding domain-containing protein [Clostridia bacterium]|nr:transporter substrate-binding domain-containing protein [Clostridia bacterium]